MNYNEFRLALNNNNELKISLDSYFSYFYARFFLKSRFELGEKSIFQKVDCTLNYLKYVIKSRYLPVEKRLKIKNQFITYLSIMKFDHE